jgi:hypothetical protein
MLSGCSLAFSRLFSASQQCFSLTTNQPTVLSAAYFQPSEQARCGKMANTSSPVEVRRKHTTDKALFG